MNEIKRDSASAGMVASLTQAVICRDVVKEFGEGDSKTRALQGIDLDVHLKEGARAGLAGAGLLDAADAVDGEGDGLGGLDDGIARAGRVGIHELVEGDAQKEPTVVADDARGEESGVVIGAGPTAG